MPSTDMGNAVRPDARNALRAALLGVGLCVGAVVHAGSPQELTIRMEKESFVPANASAAAGMHITWINSDTIPHSVTAGENGFDSGPVLPGKSFEWTANTTGAIAYHCVFHPSMTAVLTVRAADKANGK